MGYTPLQYILESYFIHNSLYLLIPYPYVACPPEVSHILKLCVLGSSLAV